MSEMGTAIMDAAERRMRRGGFSGFSFRELAEDVGIKSASVHYHFPTKETLAAAVIRRYRERVAELIERRLRHDSNSIRVWVRAFRGTLRSEDQMCPATVLAASSLDLPAELNTEVGLFFNMCIDKLIESGSSKDEASHVIATITGALVLANSMQDHAVYDHATKDLITPPVPSKKARRPSA